MLRGHGKTASRQRSKRFVAAFDAVYQATFLDAPWGGRSDFLVRADAPSALGAWSYEVVETKLARSTKATALVQLCFYSDLLVADSRFGTEEDARGAGRHS